LFQNHKMKSSMRRLCRIGHGPMTSGTRSSSLSTSILFQTSRRPSNLGRFLASSSSQISSHNATGSDHADGSQLPALAVPPAEETSESARDRAEALVVAGQREEAGGRWAAALRAYDQAAAQQPGLPSAHTARGHLLAMAGRPEEALAAYEEVRERAWPDDVRLLACN
jgi:tetratricopeptide (TPR) repeat protein